MVLCFIKQRNAILYYLIIWLQVKSDFSDILFLESYANTLEKFDCDSP